MNKQSAQEIIDWLNKNQAVFTRMSNQIWQTPEIAYQEFKSSRLQADYLEKEGFSITWEVGGLNTAFVADWGKGKPVLGFIGEYDALPGLSQKLQPTKEAIEEGGNGHGCGHNLLGTGAVASAVAVQKWLESTEKIGTVRYYGCPAEETGTGKVFMARSGAFDNLDAAFNFHPANINMANKGSAVGINAIYYHFFGRTAHAGMAPHEGRSALDAVELMNVGVNYLREHVKDNVRIHYIITEGGHAPNIVPEEAEVYYYIRASKPDYLDEVVERVRMVAEGAAMMTETRLEVRFKAGCSPVLSNHYLSDLQYQAMELIGSIQFSEEEIDFAQQINDAFPGNNADYINNLIDFYSPGPELSAVFDQYREKPLVGANFPAMDVGKVMTGSTDVGDLSWVAPVSMLETTCFPTGTPGHTWGEVASGGMSIGHKGMLHAAKIMAVAAMEVYTNPEHLVKIREEFERSTDGKPYVSPIPAHINPPRFKPLED